jgi:N-acetylmuramoyl-L-alanine amidase
MTTTPSGDALVRLARTRIGDRYDFVLVPKDNPKWSGPWDCAELVSWCVYQVAKILYGCQSNSANPAVADAWTGYWLRDAKTLGIQVSIERAAGTPGAAVLRAAQPGRIGHIVLSDGLGGTVEAHSRARGVIGHTLHGRRWDLGILVPGIQYNEIATPVTPHAPRTAVYRLTTPPMKGEVVRRIQRALTGVGYHPGPVDGLYGPQTHAAVAAFQAARRVLVDGEVGPQTARALGITLG